MPQPPEPQPTEQELAQQEHRASRNLWHGLISLAGLIVLVVALVLAVPGLHGVARAVTRMNVWWLVAGIVLEIVSCVGYILAFLQVFDRAPVRFGARVALSELAFGVAVSLGGVGSAAVGTMLLVERGGRPGRVAERSAVLFLLTSAINVITLAFTGLALWAGLLPGTHNVLLSLVPGVVGVVVFFAFMALPRIFERHTDLEAPGRLHLLARETAITVRQTERLLFSGDWRLIGSFAYLWADIAVLAACFAAEGRTPPLSTIVLAYQIGYLANAVPIPGNIGILDGSIVGMFVLYGVSATAATAAEVVYHAISLWVPAVWGTIAFLVLRHTRGQPIALRPPREERRRLRELERRQRAERRRQLREGHRRREGERARR
jgi:uncharacterized membrane protein YbhN (UPF0104 family)